MSAGLAPTPAAPPPLGLLPRGSGPSPGGAAPQPPFLLRSPASDDLNSCDRPEAAGLARAGSPPGDGRWPPSEPESPTLAFARGLAAAARKRQTLSLAADHRAAPPRLRAPPRAAEEAAALLRPQRTLPLGDAKHRLAASPARRDLPRQPPSPPVQDRARAAARRAVLGEVEFLPLNDAPGRAPLSPPSPSASRPSARAAKDLRSLRLRRFFDLENSGLAEPHSACGSEPLPKKAHSVDHSNAIERRPLPKK
ncbi:hypothetical protein SO694_00001149 [Aureococcus anophagefferens]|uniref:Uncharacterized protein n=1 Tax=Aureococcus anophagefferens TaxID=44056 RepID=A0ABR1GBJ7_AURAN